MFVYVCAYVCVHAYTHAPSDQIKLFKLLTSLANHPIPMHPRSHAPHAQNPPDLEKY